MHRLGRHLYALHRLSILVPRQFLSTWASSAPAPSGKLKAEMNKLASMINQYGESHEVVLDHMSELAAYSVQEEDYKTAAQVFLSLYAHKKRSLGDDHHEVAAARMDLGLMYFRLGTFSDIKTLIDELILYQQFSHLEDMLLTAIDMVERPYWEPDFELHVMNGLSTALFCQRKFVEAEEHMRKLLKLQKQHLGNTDAIVGVTLVNLGTTLYNLGKYEEAEVTQREALTVQKKCAGLESLSVAVTKSNLAASLIHLEKFAEAERLLKEAIPVKRRTQGKQSVGVDLAHYGKVLIHRERYRKAEDVLRKALLIQQETLGKDDPQVAVVLNYLGSSLHLQEKYEDAMETFRKAIHLWGKALPSDSSEMLSLKSALATSMLQAGKHHEAKAVLSEVLPILQGNLGETHPFVSAMSCDLAGAFLSCGDHAEAEALFKAALVHRVSLLGDFHIDVAGLMHSIGDALGAQRKFDEALEWYGKAIDIFRRPNNSSAAGTAESLASSLSATSAILLHLKRYDEAERICREELIIQGNILGSAHPAMGKVLCMLGHICERVGKTEEASELFDRALKTVLSGGAVNDGTNVGRIARDLGHKLLERGAVDDAEQCFMKALDVAHDTNHETSAAQAEALDDLATVHCKKDDFVTAEKFSKKALELRTAFHDEGHVMIAHTSVNLGGILCHQNKYTEAISFIESALPILEYHLGEVHIDVADALCNLGMALASLGQYADAEPVQRRALEMRQALGCGEDSRSASLWQNLALILSNQGKPDAAIVAARETCRILEQSSGKNHSEYLMAEGCLAMALYEKGEFEEAEPLYRKILQNQLKRYGRQHPEVPMLMADLGVMLQSRGDLEGSEAMSRDCLAILQRILGNRHPEVAKSQTALGNVLLELGRPGEAYQAFKAAVAIRLDSTDDIDEQTFYTLCSMATSLNLQNDYSEAERVYKDIIRYHKKLAGDDKVGEDFKKNVRLGKILHSLGKVLLNQNKYFEAENVFRGALKALMDEFGVWEHPEVESCRSDLYESLVAQGKRKEADDLGL